MVTSCEQVWREISNYIEGEVDASLRAAMDEHFRACARCRSVLAGTQTVIRLYSDERMIEAPSGFSRRLQHRLSKVPRSIRSWSSWSAWMVPVAALLLFAGGLRLANSLSTGEPLKSEHAQQAHDIPPDMPVIVTADAKVFHAPGCTFIHNKATERTLTAKQAIEQGYVPCLRCLRKYLNTDVARSAETDHDDDATTNEHDSASSHAQAGGD